MAQAAVKDTTGYVNYVYNISARGTTEVASQLLGLSGMATNILGQLAFQTSSYLSTTEGALLSMGVIATAGFTKATQQAMEFDQALSTVGAISGKTRDEVSSLGDDAMAMSSKFGVAVSEMTQGMESLARAGVSQGNMTAILEEAMGLSKLEGLTLDTAINDLISTTNLLDTQGLDLSSAEYADAVRYQNQKITATSEAAPINAQDIIHTLEHIGGYASSTNLDQDDLYAVIAQLGSKGTKSEMAGTSLRAFISAGQKDTAQRALDRIGLSVKDLWKNDDTIMSITDMKDVLDEAMESRGYTQQEKLEFYSDFAGYKQANQIMKIDTQSAREFKEKIDHSWNMGQKINQVIGTAETHVQGLIQAGTNLLTKVGEPFLPIISTIAWTLRTGIDMINAIPGSNLIIAGGLILASVKAISTIFNKIVPQIVAAKGNIGSMGGFFGTIKKDLKESYTIIKNINNTDWIQSYAHQNEMNRVTDNDKLDYWREKTGKQLYGMTDVYKLEKRHKFTNNQPYIDWKRRERYSTRDSRNERHETQNEPTGAAESSNNRKDNKKSNCCDLIIQVMKEGFVNQIYNSNTIKDRVIDIYNSISSSLSKIKDTTFKVVVTNSANNVIPMHDVGKQKYNFSKRHLEKHNKIKDDKETTNNSHRTNKSSNTTSSDIDQQRVTESISSVDINKLKTARLFTLDDPHITEKKLSEFADILADSVDFGFDINTSEGKVASEYLKKLLHEVFLTNARNNGVFFKGGTQKSLESTINRALHGPTMLSDGSTKIGGVEGFASSKLDSILANTEGYKNYTSEDIEKITIDRGIFRHDWDYDVNKRRETENEWIQRGKDFLTTLQYRGNPMVELVNEEVKLNKEGHNFVSSVIKNVNNMGIKRKEQLARDFGILSESWEEQKHLLSNEEMHNILNYDIEKKIMSASGINRYENAVKINKYLPKTKQISELSNNPIETVRKISLSNLGENFTITQYKEIIKGLNDYFHFGISTEDIEKEKQKIIDEINKSDLTNEERKTELNNVNKNAYKNIVSDKIDTLLKSNVLDDDLINFAQYLQPKLERPNDKDIFNSIGFSYNAFTDNNKISKEESTQLLELLAHLSGVSLKGLKTDGKTYRSSVAKRIVNKAEKINLEPIQEMYNDPMTYFFMNDLGSNEQQQFIKEMGLKNTKPLFALHEYMEGVKSGDFNYEEGYNFVKQLGHITEFEEDKLNVAGGYYGDLSGGPNVMSSPNKEVERILKTYGEDGYHGLISYMNEISNAAMEIVTQKSLDDIEKALQEDRGEKGKVDKREILKMVDNLRRNRRTTYNYHKVTEDDEDNLGLLETIIEGLWHRTDSKKSNEIKKTKHKKAKWNLEGYRFILNPDPKKWEEFENFIIDVVSSGGIASDQVSDKVIWSKAMKDMLNLTTDFDKFQHKISTLENIGPLRKTGTAELEPLSYIFEGMRINTFQRKPTHGRNMENTAVINDAGQLVGFQANAHGDYREAYNWALERRRNKIYLEEDQKDAYAAIALRTGLSRYDIRSMGLTDYQKAEAEELYAQQDFVNIPEFIKKYDELYAKGESELTGEEAFRQLRGQMASANKVDDKGKIIGNMFHRNVTLKEYERLKNLNLINLNEGNQGVLGIAETDDEGNATKYKINDYSMLHYSKEDIERNIQLRDIGRALRAEQGRIQDYDITMGVDPLQIARDLLTKRPTEISQALESIYVYDKNLANNILYYAQKILYDEITTGNLQGIGVTPISEFNESMKSAYQKNDFLNNVQDTFGEEALGYFDTDFLNDMFDKVYNASESDFNKVSGEVLSEMIDYYNDIVNAGLDDLKELDLTEAQQSEFLSGLEVGADADWGQHMQYEGVDFNSRLEDVIDPQQRELITNEFGQAIYALGSEAISKQKIYNPKTGKHEIVDVESSIGILADQLSKSLDPERGDNTKAVLLRLNKLKEFAQVRKEEWDNSFLGGIDVKAYNAIGSTPIQDTEQTPISNTKSPQNNARKTVIEPVQDSFLNGIDVALFNNLGTNLNNKTQVGGYEQGREVVDNIRQRLDNFISPKIDTLYGRFGDRDNSDITDKLGGWSDKLTDATDTLQGFSVYLQEASELFPPLSVAVLGLETVITTITKINEGTQALSSFLDIGKSLKAGETFEFLGQTFSSNTNAGKMLMSATGIVGEAVETLTTIFWEFLGPIALITAGLIAIKGALDWSYQSHQKYLKSLEEDQKEHRSKVKGLQATNENAQERARNNRAPRQQAALDRNAQLAQTRLDNANMTRSHGAIEITRQKNDTLWGEYGISAGLSKLQGNYESTASEYDGTSGQIRRIKEATLANPFSSDAMNQVASYYDANQLAFGVMDEYKDELGKLYDSETSAMLKYHSDDVRGSPEFNKALDDFVEATGITRDHAKQYLDYMQTEHEVDKATQAMQAQADQISANTELKVQAIAFGGNPADVLGLNGIEAQQGAMIKAQADMIKMELSGQLWWKAVWSTITTPIKLILSPIFIIVDLLNAIWSLMTGNIGGAFESGGRAASRLNVFGEAATYWGAWADTESTDFNAIGQSATDSYNRANYGNVEQPASGGYHPTHYIDSNQSNDKRESQTHYMNANRGSYHFMSDRNRSGNQPTEQLNPLSSIGSMLSTIISILTTGLLVGGGIYGLTKFLKSDLSLGELGGGILSTITGDGPRILGDIFGGIFKEGTIMGKIKDKFAPITDLFKDSFGTRKDQIKGFFGFDNVKDAGSGLLGKGSGLLGKIDEKIGFSENPVVQNWKTYFGSKLVTDDFNKKKRKGMNASDREFLNEKYNLGIDFDETDEKGRRKYRTADQKNKAIRDALDEKGKWNEAMGELYGRDYVDVKDAIGSRVQSLKEDYANPWKEYLGNKASKKKQQGTQYIKTYLDNLKTQADIYNGKGPTHMGKDVIDQETFRENASLPVKMLGEALNVKEKVFGKAENTDFNALLQNPKKFLSDPRNIEGMGRDIYKTQKKKFFESDFYKNTRAEAETYRKDPKTGDGASIQAKLMGKALDWKDKYLQGDSISDVLKDPERTVDILQGTWKDLQGGALDDLNIGETVKDKVSGFFNDIKEGAEEGIDDDEEGGSGGIIQKAKEKLAGFFGFGKEDTSPITKEEIEEKEKSGDFTKISDWKKEKVEEIQTPSLSNRITNKMKNIFGSKEEKEPISNIGKMANMDVEGLDALQKSGLSTGGIMGNTFIESSAGAVEEDASILDLNSLGDVNDGLKTGGKITQKIGGFLKGKKGIAGKAGNVLENIGGGASKAGSKGVGGIVKGGLSKLGKTGIGKAVSGLGKKAIGGIGKKLATKGIAQVGSKILGGALMATGIGAPLGLLLESPIGGFLIEGAMNLGGKALGAIGGAVGGVGKAIGGLLGFGPKTHYQNANNGGGFNPLGMLPGVGALGAIAGGIGGMLGGLFGGNKKQGQNQGMLGALSGGLGLMKMVNPLAMGVGLLGSIFKNNKDQKSHTSDIGDTAKKILKNVIAGNNQKQGNESGGNITIQNININTSDDPEAIKAMFLELLIELQEQVNPRIVSRTVGTESSNSTTSTDTSTDSTTDTNAEKTTNESLYRG